MDRKYLTPEGHAAAKAELEELKGPQRLALSMRLRDAISMGDLSENADYHKAKEDQGFLEGRIQELEYLLSTAEIIDHKAGSMDNVQVGATVTVQEEDNPEEKFHIVGAKEADPRNGKISNESPVGRALLGARVGDKVTVQSLEGEFQFKILKIE